MPAVLFAKKKKQEVPKISVASDEAGELVLGHTRRDVAAVFHNRDGVLACRTR